MLTTRQTEHPRTLIQFSDAHPLQYARFARAERCPGSAALNGAHSAANRLENNSHLNGGAP